MNAESLDSNEEEKIPPVENQLILSNVVVPYKGYPKGYNVVMYNDNHTPFDVVIDTLMTCGLTEDKAIEIATIVHRKGFWYIPCYDTKMIADQTEKNLRRNGIQAEIIFEEAEPQPLQETESGN
jgi:ATP-dependent Clp protease adapter protein ClpS